MTLHPHSRSSGRTMVGSALAMVVAGTGLGLAPAAHAVDPPDAPSSLAAALSVDPSLVTGASLVTAPPAGGTAISSTTPILGFPVHGDSYTILSSGHVDNVDPDLGGQNESRNGGNVRGNTDFDVTIFKLDVDVPASANCLSTLTFRFLSQEYPVYVGSSYNDAFLFEIDESTWSTDGSEISVANNLAFDELGNIISINAAGAATMSESRAVGSGLNGSTRTLTASAPISPGAHSLYFSIFDQGDHVLDSAVLLDNLQFSHVEDPAVECQPGVTPEYGNPVSATEPTFTDGENPSVSIPDVDGLQYFIDGEPVEAGDHSLEPGTIVTVSVALASGDDYLDGPSEWSHFVPGGQALTPVTPAAPTFADNPGSDADTVTIPSTTGVQYYLDYDPVSAGTYDVPWGYTEVQAYPLDGYAINGASNWQWTYETEGVARPTQLSPGTSRAGKAAAAAGVVAQEPTADLEAGTYTIPASEGVDYYANNQYVEAGTYPGSGTVTVDAYSSGTDPLNGANTWSFTFPLENLEPVSAAAPVFTDSDQGGGTVQIPSVTGVEYLVNNEVTEAGTHPAGGEVAVKARGLAGYVVEGVTGWSKTFTTAALTPVSPTAPTFDDQPGPAGDSYTIPAKLGVRYVIDGDVVAPGTYPVDHASPEVEVSAVPTAGYTLTGTTTWSHVFSALLPIAAGTPTISGDAVVGETLQADPGTWDPSDVGFSYQWLRDDAPIDGATAASYSLVEADRGQPISVQVTGSKAGHDSATATSAPTSDVLGVISMAKPKVKGKTFVGKKLKAQPGAGSPEGVSHSYQWYRGDKAIKNATAKKYKLTKKDKGKKLKVLVTAAKDGYVSASEMSSATKKIKVKRKKK